MTSHPSPVPHAAADVLEALRSATAGRHAVVDSGMPLAAQDPALGDYREHLAILRAWLAPTEQWLASYGDGPTGHPMVAPVARTGLIDADLQEPAVAQPVPRIDAITWAAAMKSAAYRWGVAYVLEGSQLGGAVLYRRLRERLAPHPLRYLAGGAEPVGARWQRFVQALRAEVTTATQIADACEGAADAFDALISVLEKFAVERVPATPADRGNA